MNRVLLLALAAVSGCTTITPAVREAVDVVSCRHDRYVLADDALSDAQKAARLQMAANLREAVGILRDGCPDYGR